MWRSFIMNLGKMKIKLDSKGKEKEESDATYFFYQIKHLIQK